MGLLNRLTIQNLKLNRKRTIVTIVGIILSVALLSAVTSMFFSARESIIDYETSVKGNFHIVFYDVKQEKADELMTGEGVEEAYGMRTLGYALEPESKNADKPYLAVVAVTKGGFENLGFQLTEGRMPENETEIVIPSHLMTNGRVKSLHVGDTVTLALGKRVADGTVLGQMIPYMGKEEMLDDTLEKTYTIVGIMNRPSSYVEPYSAPGYSCVTVCGDETFDNILENEYNRMSVFIRFNPEAAKKAGQYIAKILGVDPVLYTKVEIDGAWDDLTDADWQYFEKMIERVTYQYDVNTYLIRLETGLFRDSVTKFLGAAVLVVAVIVVLTSVFCIRNSFAISITEKTKLYGMLASVGATRKQIRKNVFYEAAILGMIGIPLGLISGLLACYVLMHIADSIVMDEYGIVLHFSFSWIALAAAVLLGILTIYLSAVGSARRASKVSPIMAIRNSGAVKWDTKKLRTPWIVKRLFGVGGVIAHKNIRRNRKKYRTTVLSIIVSVAVFVALSSFMTLVNDAVKLDFQSTEWNLCCSIEGSGSGEEQTILDEVASIAAAHSSDCALVRSVDLSITQPVFSQSYQAYLGNYDEEAYIVMASIGEENFRKYVQSLGVDADTLQNKAVLVNLTPTVSDNGIVYVEEFGYAIGDKVTGTLFANDEQGEVPFSVEIGACTVSKPFGLQTQQQAMLIVPDSIFDAQYRENAMCWVYCLTEDPDALQDEIENAFPDENITMRNQAQSMREMRSFYNLIALFLYGFILVIILIGVTNIFNTVTTNMELRRPEFAMLRSVGMTNSEFHYMVRMESLLYGMRALLIGLPIGVALSYLIYYVLVVRSGEAVVIPFRLPVAAMLLATAAVFLLLTCIMQFSVKMIGKQNVVETIRNENI